jgi:hypothetical protein
MCIFEVCQNLYPYLSNNAIMDNQQDNADIKHGLKCAIRRHRELVHTLSLPMFSQGCRRLAKVRKK